MAGGKERIKARRKAAALRKKRKRKSLLLFLIILVLLVVALFFIFSSSVFDIKKVEVKGNRRLPTKKSLELAKIPPKINFFKVPSARIRKGVLQEPWVREVKVKRVFPNKLQLVIKEREPLAIVDLEEAFILVDADSFVLEKRQSLEGLNFPVIKDLRVKKLPVGKEVKTKALANALKALRELNPFLKSTVKIITAPSVDKLTLFTGEGVEILYGEAKNTAKKNYVLKKILTKDPQNIIFIDIRVASNPVVKRLQPAP